MRKSILTTLTTAALLSSPSSIIAQDNLYPPPPPAGAASVRVVDVRAKPSKVPVKVGEKALNTSAEPTRFTYVDQGDKQVSSPGFSASRKIVAGQFYTLMVGNRTSVLYHEQKPPLTQALVVLYNLSLLPDVSLKTDDGTTTVIEPQKPFQVASQPVNPLKAGFSVYQGDTKIGDVPAAQLQRGASFGIFVMSSGSTPRVVTAPGPSLSR